MTTVDLHFIEGGRLDASFAVVQDVDHRLPKHEQLGSEHHARRYVATLLRLWLRDAWLLLDHSLYTDDLTNI